MDCYEHALQYREHLMSSAEVFRRYNKLIKPNTVSAIVFAFATAGVPEFALVCEWGDDPSRPERDMDTLLTYGDPIGVARLSTSGEGNDFVPFAGHGWTSNHSAAIIDQAYHTMPMWRHL